MVLYLVYFLKADTGSLYTPLSLYKIGHTTNGADLRKAQLNSGPYELFAKYAAKLLSRREMLDAEKEFHRLLTQYHKRREWYLIPDGVLEALATAGFISSKIPEPEPYEYGVWDLMMDMERN
jgi:hypothetical protein